MAKIPRVLALLVVGFCAPTWLAGCNEAPPAPPPPKPPEVQVSVPVSREVIDYEEFTGRTEAVETVEVRARVTGYLEKVNFKEGMEVKKGDVLFEIDARPYEAERARAAAGLEQAQAHKDRLDRDYRRAVTLLPGGSMSKEDYDKAVGDRAEAVAAVGVSQAMLEVATLNLSFTKVRAPTSGRISRRLVDPGNMVKADETPLTTIVSLDPIYAYFDVDERTVLRIRRLVHEGQMQSVSASSLPVSMGLADEEGYPHKGTINFEDNKVDSGTGSLWLRGTFPNPERLLSPGLFVRVQLPVGRPHKAILVAEQALGRDQGQKFIYVVNSDKAVVYRPVKVGRLYDGLRVVSEGVAMGEQVVVNGLQRIRPGIKVDPSLVDMPRTQAQAAPAAEKAGGDSKPPKKT
jgi:RND family efflux transporter MFP subunit